eukprot:4982116-Amphidinium_carterae.1
MAVHMANVFGICALRVSRGTKSNPRLVVFGHSMLSQSAEAPNCFNMQQIEEAKFLKILFVRKALQKLGGQGVSWKEPTISAASFEHFDGARTGGSSMTT